MLKSKYKVGDLVQSWDAVVVGLVIKVEECGLDCSLPKGNNDNFKYIVKTSTKNILYFESELNLVS